MPAPTKNVPYTMELFSKITGPSPQQFTNKALVALVAGEPAKPTLRTYFLGFSGGVPAPESISNYTVILFIYDSSSWIDEWFYPAVVTIHVSRQMKWWYIKRFITPDVSRGYTGILLMDDDVALNFSLHVFQDFALRHGAHIAQPSRDPRNKEDGSESYALTRQQPGSTVRFTDFVECGPLTWIRGDSWPCVWSVIDSATSSGWGLDMVWCRYAAEECGLGTKACAVIDAFPMTHLDRRVTRSRDDYDPHAEWVYYVEKYSRWHSRLRVLETVKATTAGAEAG